MKRREFIKYGTGGLAALVFGNIPGISGNQAFGVAPPPPQKVGVINLTVTDAIKEMVTHNTGKLPNGTTVGPGNPAHCYFWIFKDSANPLPADCPGADYLCHYGLRPLKVNCDQ